MIYFLILILSFFLNALGFAIEISEGNIRHIENGREPNAGAALFPVIPFTQIAFLGLAFLGNLYKPNWGFYGVVALLSILILVSIPQLLLKRSEEKSMVQNANS